MRTKDKQTPQKHQNIFFTNREPGEFFSTHRGGVKKVSTRILKFSKLYGHLRFWHKAVISFLLGLLMAVLTLILVEESGLYTGGISAFFTGVARFVRVSLYVKHPEIAHSTIQLIYTLLFWGLYLLFNIPLFILAYKKIGHQFAILSLIYLATLQGFGFLFNQSFCSGLHNLSLLGDTTTVNSILADNQVKSLIFYNRYLPTLVDVNPTVLDWTKLVSRSSADIFVVHSIDSTNLTRIFCLFLYAIVFAIIGGISQSVLMVTGSSTAGSDIISMYFSEQKNKSVGSILMFINVTGLILAITLGTYGAGIMIDTKYVGVEYFFSGNLICSALWAILNSVIVNIFFPWKKMVKVEIYTEKWEEIKAYLFSVGYPFGITQINAVGAKENNNFVVGLTITQLVVVPRIAKYARAIDNNCLISVSYVNDLDGNINILKQASNRPISIPKKPKSSKAK